MAKIKHFLKEQYFQFFFDEKNKLKNTWLKNISFIWNFLHLKFSGIESLLTKYINLKSFDSIEKGSADYHLISVVSEKQIFFIPFFEKIMIDALRFNTLKAKGNILFNGPTPTSELLTALDKNFSYQCISGTDLLLVKVKELIKNSDSNTVLLNIPTDIALSDQEFFQSLNSLEKEIIFIQSFDNAQKYRLFSSDILELTKPIDYKCPNDALERVKEFKEFAIEYPVIKKLHSFYQSKNLLMEENDEYFFLYKKLIAFRFYSPNDSLFPQLNPAVDGNYQNYIESDRELNSLIEKIKNRKILASTIGTRPTMPKNPDGRVLVHLGPGDQDDPQYTNVDSRDLPHIHIVEDVFSSNIFEPGSVDLIYACHLLEHVKYQDTIKMLQNWHTWLKPKGVLRLSVPDFSKITDTYNATKSISSIQTALMGGQNYAANFHLAMFDQHFLKNCLEKAGFKQSRKWHPEECREYTFNDWASKKMTYNNQNFEISLNLEATKS